jgi:hypothetical protein
LSRFAPHECEYAEQVTTLALPITWMVGAFQNWHFGKIKRVDTVDTGCIHAKLVRVRPSLVMRVNSADGTEIVFRGVGVELVAAEPVFTLDEGYVTNPSRYSNSSAHPAIRTVAAARGVQTVCECHLELHNTAMARRFHRLNSNLASASGTR